MGYLILYRRSQEEQRAGKADRALKRRRDMAVVQNVIPILTNQQCTCNNVPLHRIYSVFANLINIIISNFTALQLLLLQNVQHVHEDLHLNPGSPSRVSIYFIPI